MTILVCPFCVIDDECDVCRSRPKGCFYSEPQDRMTGQLFEDEPDFVAAEYEEYRQRMSA
jgi:hypothetical protein